MRLRPGARPDSIRRAPARWRRSSRAGRYRRGGARAWRCASDAADHGTRRRAPRPSRPSRRPPRRARSSLAGGAGRAGRAGSAPAAHPAAVDAADGQPGRTERLTAPDRAAAGQTADAGPEGFAIPLDACVVDPRAYARVTGDDAVGRAALGHALLLGDLRAVRARDSSGDRLMLAGGRSPTRRRRRARRRRARRRARRSPPPTSRAASAARPRSSSPPPTRDGDRARRPRRPAHPRRGARPGPSTGATRAAGSSDRSQLKRRFGEFAVRLPYGDDWITIDPAWRATQDRHPPRPDPRRGDVPPRD